MGKGRRSARAASIIGLLALTGAPAAHAATGSKPNGNELWRAYPLEPTATATATATATNRPAASPTRTPARAPANGGDGGSSLPIILVVLAAGPAVTAAVLLRRRRPNAAPAPAPSAEVSNPRRAPSRAPVAAKALSPAPARAYNSPTAERLRAAVDIRHAREWPWPDGSESLWRCEIGPDPAALSARFRAVVHPPDGGPPRVLALSAAEPAGGDWQSADPLMRAVDALAAELEAEGWEVVEGGGDPHRRRLCWRGEGAPDVRLKETAWSA